MTRDEFMSVCAGLTAEELEWVRRVLNIMEQNNSAAMKVLDGFLDQVKAAPRGTIPHARFGEILDEAEAAAEGGKAS